ncbi:DUF6379 domain-containing protein [Lachnospiraceae bacterium C1.1]|nr:DUF6379 domain-containing protein [Lachnospiraceae bacterium C1.1]
MAGRVVFNPKAFANVEKDGKIIGFSFEIKAQYYRGITLSIVRDIKINIDGEDVKREDIRFSVNGETFTLEEMRTVIDSDYRWEFGEYAVVTVLKEGGLSKGKHHIKALQVIAPSYMPFQIESMNEADFEI